MTHRSSTFRKTSIKTKVTMSILLTVSTLLLSVSLGLFYFFHNILRDSIMDQQYKMTSEIANHLNGRIEMAQAQLALVAKDHGTHVIHNQTALQKSLDEEDDARLLFDAGFQVIGLDGRLISESPLVPDRIGMYMGDYSYVRETIQTKKPVMSGPLRSDFAPHTPMIVFTEPIRNSSGAMVALLAGRHTLGASRYLTATSAENLGTSGYLYILHERTILMHPDSSRLLEVIPKGKNPGIDHAMTGEEGSLDNTTSRGLRMLSSFKRVGHTKWLLAANTPYAEVFKPLHRLGVITAVILSLGMIFVMLLSWYCTLRLTRPIQQLTDHVDRITNSDDDWAPLELHTSDEIGHLAEVFNGMMTEVEKSKQALTEKKEFYSGIIQNAAAPMFVIDNNHTILFWNSALAKLTGKSSFQMKNTKLQWSPFYPSQRPVLADLVIDHKRGLIDQLYTNFETSMFVDGAFQSEGWFDNIGGTRRYLLFAAAPIMNSRNEIVAAVETLEDITERKLAQEAMASHNLFLQEILDTIPNPVFYKDTTGAYIGCNKSFQTFVGHGLKDVVGKSIAEIMPGKYAEESKQHDHEIIQEKIGFSYEGDVQRYDGRERHVLITKAPFFTSSGELGGIVGAFVDITEQQQLDEQIRTMSRAVEQSPATIVITDVTGAIEYVNPKFCQTTGYTAEEAIGQNPRVLKTDEMSTAAYAELWETITSGREWRGEFHNKRKDGTLFWEFATISPLNDKDGHITGYLAVKEDITERKAVEAELAQSRQELEAKHIELGQIFDQVAAAKQEWEQTLDHLRDFVILTDADHRVRRYNRLLSDITGRPIDELVGADWRELINEAGFRFVAFNDTSGEIFHQRLGRSYDITIFAIEDNGVVTGHVISINDTTELRAATQELEKAYAELKEVQLQIFQQEKLASIGQLAAGVAHEINNPMGFISSNLATLNKYIERLAEFIAASDQSLSFCGGSGEVDKLNDLRKRLKIDYILEDSCQLIAESQDGAGRVRSIVQDLKSFSRVDQAECALIDLNETLETTINIAWNEIKYVATLNRELGDVPRINCYPQQLNQVFLNLLVNAAHALEGNQGTITVRTWNEGNDVLVSVADTGCGIPDEIQKRIFEPFFTTKDVGKGTGLGLSISYDIIRKHGGEITVESAVGRGTIFTVRLPVSAPQG